MSNPAAEHAMPPPGGDQAQPPHDAVIELDNVSHSYRARGANFEHGEHTVLDGVSFAVHKGETLGIIGRNGAGKTTLLRLMAGILAPRRGKIRRAPGTRCSLLSLGLGFQNDLSGRDNARLSALLQGASRSEAESFLEAINDFAELGSSFDEPVKTYSAGMRARLGFATALQTKVDVLLIDEVLSVGDRPFKEKATAAMKAHISGVQTVVLVSHGEDQLRELCDRAVLIDGGCLVAQGRTVDVLEVYRGSNG
jgi:lipopolysaccharide transport system ATP-binding protein